MGETPKPAVLIVEDERETRERLVRVIEESDALNCVAACGSYAEGLKALVDHQPDILLVDIDLPDGTGLDLIAYLHQQALPCQAIVITVFEDDRHVIDAISAGAAGYVLKDDPSMSIEQAIILILSGGAPISPAVARHILARFHETQEAAPSKDAQEKLMSLTSREREILILVSDGYTDQEIADKVSISYYTVTTHVKHIYQKLSVSTRVEATRQAIRFGIVGSD